MIRSPKGIVIELKPSAIHRGGVGVFAAARLRRGQKIADGIAEEDFKDIVPWTDFESYDGELRKKVLSFCVGTPEGFVPPPDFDFNKLTIEWYFNHSCDGNCGFDDGGDFTAIQDIEAGEEIAYDYGLVESNPAFRLHCTCGSRNCRSIVTGNDWKDEQFANKNREQMHPHLRHLITVPA